MGSLVLLALILGLLVVRYFKILWWAR